MKKIICFILLCGLCVIILFSAEGKSLYHEKSKLTSSEIKQFENAEKKYPNFHYSSEVVRYYEIDSKIKQKKLVLIEMIFKEKDGLYFEEYVSYSTAYDPISKIAHYTFDAGTANRGEGVVIFCGEKPLNVKWSCGTTNCGLYIWDDTKQLKMEP